MHMDFQVHDHRCSKELGITLFEGGGRIIIYLHHHETIPDIYSTITHECIHYCIGEDYPIDEYQEHDLIFRMLWIEEYIPEEEVGFTPLLP